MRQNVIDQQSGTVRHPSRATTGTEATSFATEGYQFLIMAGFTPDPEKTIFKSPALQIRIKLLCDVRWQGLVVAGQLGLIRPVLLNDLLIQAGIKVKNYVKPCTTATEL